MLSRLVYQNLGYYNNNVQVVSLASLGSRLITYIREDGTRGLKRLGAIPIEILSSGNPLHHTTFDSNPSRHGKVKTYLTQNTFVRKEWAKRVLEKALTETFFIPNAEGRT